MTQLGEPVAIGIVVEANVKCPFDHENDKPPTIANELKGVGSKLSSRMSKKSPQGTYKYSVMKARYELSGDDRIPNPRKEGHLVKGTTPVKVKFATGTELSYPLSVAAHHCIPAQESLKKVTGLLQFMVKKGKKAGWGGSGDFTGSKVWSNVGYDVNGLQNGVFLPGSYAVGGGRGGLKKWKPSDTNDSEAPDGSETPAPNSDLLVGRPVSSLLKLDGSNPCWGYVWEATQVAPGQFHDRHRQYSEHVIGLLTMMAEDLERFENKSITNSECPDCQARIDKIKELGIPTDYDLVTRLNNLSQAYKNKLEGKGPGWTKGIFTSRWMDAYLESKP